RAKAGAQDDRPSLNLAGVRVGLRCRETGQVPSLQSGGTGAACVGSYKAISAQIGAGRRHPRPTYFGTCRASGKSGFIKELPPSTVIVCPVTNEASSLQSSAHMLATSEGVTRRGMGVQPAAAQSFTAACTSLGVCPNRVVSSEIPGLT